MSTIVCADVTDKNGKIEMYRGVESIHIGNSGSLLITYGENESFAYAPGQWINVREYTEEE